MRPRKPWKHFTQGLRLRSVLEYRAQIWNGGLTKAQCKDIERINSETGIKDYIHAELDYDQAIRNIWS